MGTGGGHSDVCPGMVQENQCHGCHTAWNRCLAEAGAVPHYLQEAPHCVKTQRGQELHLRAEGKIAAGCPLNVLLVLLAES